MLESSEISAQISSGITAESGISPPKTSSKLGAIAASAGISATVSRTVGNSSNSGKAKVSRSIPAPKTSSREAAMGSVNSVSSVLMLVANSVSGTTDKTSGITSSSSSSPQNRSLMVDIFVVSAAVTRGIFSSTTVKAISWSEGLPPSWRSPFCRTWLQPFCQSARANSAIKRD